MRTNIVIDDKLMRGAMRASRLGTKRAVVEAGLRLLIAVRAQARVRRFRGRVVWRGDLGQMRTSRVKAV